MLVLCGCSAPPQGPPSLLEMGQDTGFAEAEGRLADLGFVLDGRDQRAYVLSGEDFQAWRPLLPDAPLLRELAADLGRLAGALPEHEAREALYLDTYLFRRPADGAEAALLFSAYDNALLELYCYLPDMTPALDAVRARGPVVGPVVSGQGEGAFALWYGEDEARAVVLDAGIDPARDPSGGAMVLFPENIEHFYARLRGRGR